MVKRHIKAACFGLLAALALAGCSTERSTNQYSFNYDPANPDKLATTLPLDIYFPPAPLSRAYQPR